MESKTGWISRSRSPSPSLSQPAASDLSSHLHLTTPYQSDDLVTPSSHPGVRGIDIPTIILIGMSQTRTLPQSGQSDNARATLRTLSQRIRPFTATLRRTVTPYLTSFRTHARTTAGKWGSVVFIAAGVYFSLPPDSRARFWCEVRALTRLDALRAYMESRRHGLRLKQVLHHVGADRGGDVLELFPGSSPTFRLLGESTLAKPASEARRCVNLSWRGVDVTDSEWRSGRIQQEACVGASIPAAQLAFDSSASSHRSVLELLRNQPDASAQYVLALNGLAPLWQSNRHLGASESTRCSVDLDRRPTSESELASLLSEVSRILKPGGRFIALERNAHNQDDFILTRMADSMSQHVRTALGSRRAVAVPLAQMAMGHDGFMSVHVEQWPEWCDTRSPRRGVRLLQARRDDEQQQQQAQHSYTPISSLHGRSPMVAVIATKSDKVPVRLPGSLRPLTPAEGGLTSIFTTPSL